MKEIMKNREIRNKILIIIGAMIFIRIGSVIPLPGINTDYMKTLLSNSGLTFFNMVTGNSFSQMSLFALSISPYITASIIIQLLTVVFPSLEELSKDGKTGREKLEKYTNFVGIGLAFIQSLFMAIGFGGRGLFSVYTWWMVLIMTFTWTVGAAILMFIGNKITKMELGNGISYILLCNILSTFPGDIFSLYEVFMNGKTIPYQIVNGMIIIILLITLVSACVILSLSERKIPIIFSGKMNGFSPKQDLPIPLNTCGVMPIIFSSSILSLPILISSFFPDLIWLSETSKYLSQNQWFKPESIKYTLGAFIYILLTYFFTTFYLNVNFNTIEMSNNLKAQGAVIPGIRPGKPTAEYIEKISTKIAFVGTTFMLIIILSLNAICNISGIGTLSIGGTSILICVSVVVDSSKVLKTMIQSSKSRTYYMTKKENTTSLFSTNRSKV